MATEDKRLTDLDFAAPAAADHLYIVDDSDTSESDEGTSKRTTVAALESYINGVTSPDYNPGDVRNFGADPEGSQDSTSAIQDAVDSGYPVIFPAGRFLISSTITVAKPTLIYMARGLRGQDTVSDDASTTVYTTSDINLFTLKTEGIWGQGGIFDMSGVTSGTKSALYYPLEANGSSSGGVGNYGGWGGGWTDFLIVGGRDAVTASLSGGSDAIHFDFANSEVSNAYWTHMKFSGEVRDCNRAFYASARNSGYSQWSNTFRLDLDCQFVKRTIHNEAINRVFAKIRHQGQEVFTSQANADATASIYSTTVNNRWDGIFFDFSGSSGGLYSNSKSFDINNSGGVGDEDIIIGPEGMDKLLNLSNAIPTYSHYASGVYRTTSSNLLNKDHFVNSSGLKREGYQVFESTNRPLWASGSAATDPWVDSSGSTVRTPS